MNEQQEDDHYSHLNKGNVVAKLAIARKVKEEKTGPQSGLYNSCFKERKEPIA